MNKKLKITIYISIFSAILLIIFNKNSFIYNLQYKNNIDSNKVYKVAFYEHPPYYYLNEKSDPSGYYHDLMKLISKELSIKFEYVYLDVAQCIDKLVNNEIDLVFGVSKDTKKEKELLFSKKSVGKENVSVYTHDNIENEDLSGLKGLKFGYLKHESNHELLLEILNKKNINVNLVEYHSYEELKQGFINNEVDSITYLSGDKDLKKYNKILNFSVGELYLATSKNNKDLMEHINTFFESNSNIIYSNPIKKIHDKYFNENFHLNKNILSISLIFSFIVIIIILIFVYRYTREKNKINKIKNKILYNLKNDNYLLFYQPIINPKSNKIKGLEGLLRLNDKGEVISPYKFLKDIENTNMMNEVSLWILRKAISDYKIIKDFECVIDGDFYISINLSFKEIEDDKFIKDVKKILKDSNLKPNSICLEIVEKFAINDLKKIQESIYKLKEAGFIVAIDDFGVEYSNLDILEKIDCDIVKLDKYFIDDINESFIRKEVVHFISNVCKYTNKTLVCEGVEDSYQEDIIKNIDNNKFYIQGYIYSKPLDINDLKNYKLK